MLSWNATYKHITSAGRIKNPSISSGVPKYHVPGPRRAVPGLCVVPGPRRAVPGLSSEG